MAGKLTFVRSVNTRKPDSAIARHATRDAAVETCVTCANRSAFGPGSRQSALIACMYRRKVTHLM